MAKDFLKLAVALLAANVVLQGMNTFEMHGLRRSVETQLVGLGGGRVVFDPSGLAQQVKTGALLTRIHAAQLSQGNSLREIERALWRAPDPGHPDFPIFADQAIFMVLERIEGEKLTFRVLRSVSSPDSKTILWVGDEVRAVLRPLAPDGTRRAACVTDILGRDGRGVILNSLRSDSCLGQVADFRGAIGLEVDKIAPELVATLSLAGDLNIVPPAPVNEGGSDE